jgi:soluble lytic murein transglycosylase
LKRRAASDNQNQMRFKLAVAALFAFALASASATGRVAAASDPCSQFAVGYRALQQRQYPDAERGLTAAALCSQLGDYALFYLADAQRESGNVNGAIATLNRLVGSYPQSVMGPAAWLALAELTEQSGQAASAAGLARGVIARGARPEIEQRARVVLAQSLTTIGDYRGAYDAWMALREAYPNGEFDGRARSAAYTLLAAHRDLADSTSPSYRREEAALLLREGQAAEARDQIQAALELLPEPAERAALLWMMARAERGNPEAERKALFRYLAAAPDGSEAPAALDRLGHLYWRVDDTKHAREMFARVTAEFPDSSYAPESMLAMGRAFEDDHRFDSARSIYRRLLARYPRSEAAERARMRLPWSLYMMRRYAEAASSFAAMAPHADNAPDRDMLMYWQARALEKSGHAAAARAIFQRLATSTASNYYPALASLRTGVRPETIAAAVGFDPVARVPETDAPGAAFHLERVSALRELGLRDLEAPELRALEPAALEHPALRNFVIAELMAARAWHEAIGTVTRLQKRGAIDSALAERVRYPIAYPDLIMPAAANAGINPYLVMALTRQESLFDPNARSVSDARGLMQLLPSTAAKLAAVEGGTPGDLYDPANNVRLGVALLKKLLTMYGGDRVRAVAAYNGGEQAVAKWNALFPGDDDAWVENIQYRETCDYVKKVIGGLREYELLYGMQPPAATRPASIR